MQEAYKSLDVKIDETSKEIKKVEQIQRAEKASTKSKLRYMEQEILNEKERNANEIETLKKQMKEITESHRTLTWTKPTC